MFPDWTTNGVYIVVGVLRLISPRLLTDRARSFFLSHFISSLDSTLFITSLFVCLLLLVTHTLPQTIFLHFSYLLLVMNSLIGWTEEKELSSFLFSSLRFLSIKTNIEWGPTIGDEPGHKRAAICARLACSGWSGCGLICPDDGLEAMFRFQDLLPHVHF